MSQSYFLIKFTKYTISPEVRDLTLFKQICWEVLVVCFLKKQSDVVGVWFQAHEALGASGYFHHVKCSSC